MDIILAPNIERLLRMKVAEGLYDSLNEAVNATLNIALNKGCISKEQLEALNADIQEGIDDIEAGRYTEGLDFFDELIADYEQT